jgi:hypothetical protein
VEQSEEMKIEDQKDPKGNKCVSETPDRLLVTITGKCIPLEARTISLMLFVA